MPATITAPAADRARVAEPTRPPDGRPVSASPRPTLPRRARNVVLTVHIAVSVALLGDVAGLVALGLKAIGTDDPETAATLYDVMSMFSLAFGIPLSMLTLVTGIVLGVGTRWGLVRYWWVIGKFGLILAVIGAGALVIGPAEGRLLDAAVGSTSRSRDEWIVVGAAGFQAIALLAATGLSVFKPGRRRDRTSRPA